ncbi:HK97 gp10 family phage protein [Halobacillus naozhouensis]|uniref:HK97 gp10 family phage protein n=1 Tax=Halobacillus naozhouensis TaxID=554880 RepID=A0ABY8J3R8_9BACI|nr:HK97 gp10 family phage protein [Halobacillus naozhouensis]WFT76242.1 HK97 gp10 family phage protein [Halobacillus naozhouensis]
MAGDFLFDIEWGGLQELEEEFDKMEEEFEEILVDEYTKYGLLVEEGSKALVHRDHGDLEESIHFDKGEIEGESVVVEGGSNLPYALRRHEEPYRMGVYDKYDNGTKYPGYYVNGRGRKTHRKPNWRGYKPGRKYLANAIIATEEDYNIMNLRVLNRTFGEES